MNEIYTVASVRNPIAAPLSCARYPGETLTLLVDYVSATPDTEATHARAFVQPLGGVVHYVGTFDAATPMPILEGHAQDTWAETSPERARQRGLVPPGLDASPSPKATYTVSRPLSWHLLAAIRAWFREAGQE